MVNNPEARAKGDTNPKVMDQQQRYHSWLNTANHKSDVLKAYRNVCRDLVAIHEKVAKSTIGADLPKLGQGILAVAEKSELLLGVDDKARLIIDNTSRDRSFEDNGHRAKLAGNGIHVRVVTKDGDHRLQGPAA